VARVALRDLAADPPLARWRPGVDLDLVEALAPRLFRRALARLRQHAVEHRARGRERQPGEQRARPERDRGRLRAAGEAAGEAHDLAVLELPAVGPALQRVRAADLARVDRRHDERAEPPPELG